MEDFLQDLYDEQEVYTGGLKIYTTLDLDYQKVAKEVFDDYTVFKNENLNGAMITVDPFSGGIISIVGGKDFKAKNFNRAIMARRQYGSTIKPFLYLTAMKNGFTPYSVVVDNFISYGSWAPKNYGGHYSGNSTLVNSLSLSINIPAIKLLDNVEVKTFAEAAKNLELSDDVKDLTAALGSVDSTPLNLALNYSIFVNGGYKVKPNFITEIRDSQDSIIYIKDIEKEKIYDSIDTSVITAILKTVVSNGSAYRARVFDKDGKQIEQGGKTGTTNDNRTLWYAGITPEYVTVAYIGRDDNKPIPGKVTGGGTVAPLWANYYQKLIKENLYTSGKFEFLENHLEVGDLIKQNIDIFSGLLDGERNREFLVPSGKLQVENKSKYENGIATIFNLDSQVTGSVENFISDLPTNNQNYFNNIPNVNINNSEDDLLNRLLGD